MTGFQHIDGMIFFLYRYFIYFSLVYWSPHEMCVNIHLILTLQGFLWYCSEIKDKNWKALLISWAMSENKTHQLPLWQCAAAIENSKYYWCMNEGSDFILHKICFAAVLMQSSLCFQGKWTLLIPVLKVSSCAAAVAVVMRRGKVFWPAAAVKSYNIQHGDVCLRNNFYS